MLRKSIADARERRLLKSKYKSNKKCHYDKVFKGQPFIPTEKEGWEKNLKGIKIA